MAALVQIPWQPTLWLTPKTLSRLLDAVGILHRQIYLNGSDAAWRSEARQEYLWDLNGHDPAKANSPFVGQRAHMKGGGLDVPTDKATRNAMIAAGFKPDANELWHFNDPDIAFMPIIRTNTAAAGGGAVLIADDPAPVIRKKRGKKMLYIHFVQENNYYLFDDSTDFAGSLAQRYHQVTDGAKLATMALLYGPPVDFPTQGVWDEYRTQIGIGVSVDAGGIDIAALATKIASQLGPASSPISDADVARIAKAVLDGEAQRLQS